MSARDQHLGLAAAHHALSRSDRYRDTAASTSGTVTRAVGVLVMLEDAGDRARKREPRSVERVNEARLLTLAPAGSECSRGAPG